MAQPLNQLRIAHSGPPVPRERAAGLPPGRHLDPQPAEPVARTSGVAVPHPASAREEGSGTPRRAAKAAARGRADADDRETKRRGNPARFGSQRDQARLVLADQQDERVRIGARRKGDVPLSRVVDPEHATAVAVGADDMNESRARLRNAR